MRAAAGLPPSSLLLGVWLQPGTARGSTAAVGRLTAGMRPGLDEAAVLRPSWSMVEEKLASGGPPDFLGELIEEVRAFFRVLAHFTRARFSITRSVRE